MESLAQIIDALAWPVAILAIVLIIKYQLK